MLVDQRDLRPRRGRPFGQIENCGQQYRNHDQEQQCREQTYTRLVEGLPRPPDAANQCGNSEEQQRRPDDRAGDLRLYHPGLRLGEDEERQHQFGDVAEADVEEPADGAAGPLRQLLGGSTHPVGKDADRGGPGDENPDRHCIEQVAQRKRQRNKEKERIAHRITVSPAGLPQAAGRGTLTL
jgi:hypothetical protein